MKCEVCATTWGDPQNQICPNCKTNQETLGKDLTSLEKARQEFRERNTAYRDPVTRIPKSEYYRPWIAIGVSILLLFLFMRACRAGYSGF